MTRSVVTVDFETYPILSRPDYPPAPVGLAIHFPGEAPRYLSWGHAAAGNTSTEAEAQEALWRAWNDPGVKLLFHNAKFDVAVATERWGFPMRPWQRIHDTMFLAFLLDPHSRSAGLKQLANEWLGMPPEEQDSVAAWVRAHKRELEATYSARFGGLKVGKGKEGAWIFAAPAGLVEPYAIGDVVRTRRLFDTMHPMVQQAGMGEAYDRERRLLPILMENEREGMRVDLPALARDVETYQAAFTFTEDVLRRRLNASGLNFDSDADVAAVLIERGIVDEQQFALTKTGGYSMSKDNLLPEQFNDPDVASVLGYRNRLKTCLSMFMEPWLRQAERYGGRITTSWNQIRGFEAGGTRTGRPSTNNHNFLNVVKSWDAGDDQYRHPSVIGVPALPLCRNYILPDEGHKWLDVDFSGQELRVFAHFEQGALWRAYNDDSALDVHKFVGAEFQRAAGRDLDRRRIKIMNFLSLYGGGAPALQKRLRCSLDEAKTLLKFHGEALPGKRLLIEEITKVIRRGDQIRTWGGRLYKAEPPGPDGRDKIYKLINYEIQGSAADITKQAIIDWHDHSEKNARFLVQVYDQICLSAPIEHAMQQLRLLVAVMTQDRLSVPMLADAAMGDAWGTVQEVRL